MIRILFSHAGASGPESRSFNNLNLRLSTSLRFAMGLAYACGANQRPWLGMLRVVVDSLHESNRHCTVDQVRFFSGYFCERELY